MPKRLFETLPAGPVADKVYSREEFAIAMAQLYGIMGWDAATGAPTRAKLEELDLAWVADQLDAVNAATAGARLAS